MSRDVITVGAEQSCRFALQLMSAASVRRLPVLDGDRPVGIVTEADIRVRAPRRLSAAREVDDEVVLGTANVVGVMSYGSSSVPMSASLAEAARAMLAHDVSTLLVVDAASMVGIVTMRDLLRAFVDLVDEAPPAGADEEGS